MAELMFELLALDDILFDEPIFLAIYRDYRHASNLGTVVDAQRYVSHEQEDWRRTAIDLLTNKHLLSKNWKDRHKIHVKRESENLRDALEEAIDILKERRLDQMLIEIDKKMIGANYETQRELQIEKIRLLPAKVKLAKKTGRVIVG